MVRKTLRKILPKNLKVNVRLLKNEIAYLRKGYTFNFAKNKNSSQTYSNTFVIRQELKSNEARVANLTNGRKRS